MEPLKLRVGIAKAQDRPLITRLCRRAVGGSDYVFRVLPTIVRGGGLFLAWNGSILVGMTNFDECIDGSGWLSVARTDPEWRGRGVATFLQQTIAAYAKRRRIRTLRLLVASDNRPSLRACARGGFSQVCEATQVSSSIRGSARHGTVAPSSPSERQLSKLLKSRHVAKTRGYVGYRRHFIKLTEDLLIRLRDQGNIYTAGQETLLVSRPDTLFRTPRSSLTILDGGIGKSLIAAREVARGLRARVLSAYIPYDAYEISVARKLRFKRTPWAKHCLVFEKRI